MAMLAEPRKKQRWSLNPRGKQWSDDSNKFGQKMLEKMGWSSGKGLGAKEQGATEHVRVKLKNDTSGIGFKNDTLDQAWTEHQEGFNEFLAQLQQSEDSKVIQKPESANNEASVKSLELKSQQSRARVHYKKFTRGKDVHKYSTKDLANIFGQKELDVKTKVKLEPDASDEPCEPVGKRNETGGLITIHGGSITDYFKNKMHSSPANGQKRKGVRSGEPKDEGSDGECYAGFGFSTEVQRDFRSTSASGSSFAFENPALDSNSPKRTASPTGARKSSKKIKTEFVFENGGLDLDYPEKSFTSTVAKVENDPEIVKEGFVNDALDLAVEVDNGQTNGQEFEVSRSQFGLANCALDISDEFIEKKRVTFNDHVEYSTDSVRKKKVVATLDKFEVETGKRKKKRKREDVEDSKSGFVNEALDAEPSEEVQDNEANERKSKRAKRRKERKVISLETIEEAAEEDKDASKERAESEEVTEIVREEAKDARGEVVEKKKKKKKKKAKETALENVTVVDITCEADGIEIEETIKCRKLQRKNDVQQEEVAKSKKRKKSEKSNDVEQTIDEGNDELSVKSVKRKKIGKINNVEACIEGGRDTKAVKEEEEIINDAEECTDRQCVEEQRAKLTKRKKKKRDAETMGEPRVADIELHEHVQLEKEKTEKGSKTDKTEKGISDKENTCDQTEDAKTPKKKEKRKKSKDKTSLDSTAETNEEDSRVEETPVKAEPEKTPSKELKISGPFQSPWSEKISKRMLKSLFYKNAIMHFPGSNIHEIKGYGVDV